MVDSISQSGGMPGIKRTTADAASKVSGGAKAGATGAAAPAATSTPASGDTMEISTSTTALPQAIQSQSGPPIEMELVTKLQERIAAGDYPIDLDAITESLFQSYLELND